MVNQLELVLIRKVTDGKLIITSYKLILLNQLLCLLYLELLHRLVDDVVEQCLPRYLVKVNRALCIVDFGDGRCDCENVVVLYAGRFGRCLVKSLAHIVSKIDLRNCGAALCVAYTLSSDPRRSALVSLTDTRHFGIPGGFVRLLLCGASYWEDTIRSGSARASGTATMNPFGLVVVNSLGRRTSLAQVAVVERPRHGGVSILGLGLRNSMRGTEARRSSCRYRKFSV
ncbi:hypothetical protein BDW72DRAFT_35340 [Aspergillus terricola var. indicus]